VRWRGVAASERLPQFDSLTVQSATNGAYAFIRRRLPDHLPYYFGRFPSQLIRLEKRLGDFRCRNHLCTATPEQWRKIINQTL